MRRLMLTSALALAGLWSAAPAAAQVFTPTYLSPEVRNDIGIYLSDGPGDLTFEGIWRGGPLGIRLGYATDVDAVVLGGAYFGAVQLEDESLDLLLTAAAQGLVGGDDEVFGAAAGVSAGYTLFPGGIAVTPYLHPRVALVHGLGDGGTDGEILAEIGAEAAFATQLVARLSVEFTDIGASVGAGIAIQPPGGE